MFRQLLATKLVHTIVLLLFAAGILAFGSGDLSDIGMVFTVGAMVLAWFLGQQYERNLVLHAGLVNPEELREAEWNAASAWDIFD